MLANVLLYTAQDPRHLFTHEYILNNCTLNVSDQHAYLGVVVHKSLSWSPHISDIVTKASRTFNFIKKRNLSKYSSQVKEFAYLTVVMQASIGIYFWCVGHSLCWKYYGATEKSTKKSRPLSVKWLWPIQVSFFNVGSNYHGQLSNLVASYLDYIHCTKYIFYHQLWLDL